MRILHCIYDHHANPWVGGGGAARAYEIYRRLSGRHDITVICGKYPGAEDYQEGRLSFRFLGSGRDNYVLSTFCYAARTAWWLRKHAFDADVLVEDFAPYNPVFSYRLKDSPVVLQLQNYLGPEILRKYNLLGAPFWLMERSYPRKFGNFIVMVGALAGRFELKGRVGVVSNGIGAELFGVESTEGGYVLFMGRMDVHQKGLDVLARAAEMSGKKFLLAGSGSKRDVKRVGRLFRGLGNVEHVGFARGPRKGELLAGAGVLVLPSRYEGQGIVVLEAAAVGKPVIVSDIPELSYAVEAGFGLSFKKGDAGDLARKIESLFGDPSLREAMGLRARQYAERFTWDRVAEDYERFLEDIASGA